MAEQQYMPINNKAALLSELQSIDHALGTETGERPRPLSWAEETRLQERRKTIKRELAEIQSRESHALQSRKTPGTNNKCGCGPKRGRVATTTDRAGNIYELRLEGATPRNLLAEVHGLIAEVKDLKKQVVANGERLRSAGLLNNSSRPSAAPAYMPLKPYFVN